MKLNRQEYFIKEYTFIKTERYVLSLKKLIDLVPEYFFSVPASSSGKYHPRFANGEGGLIRHTKVAVRIAKELLYHPIFGEDFTQKEKDLMIVALVLHDCMKYGDPKQPRTLKEHPLLAVSFIKKHKDQLSFTDKEIRFLEVVIASHMGPWNKNDKGVEILPIPKSKYEKLVHLCDSLSSKKYLDAWFDRNGLLVDY